MFIDIIEIKEFSTFLQTNHKYSVKRFFILVLKISDRIESLEENENLETVSALLVDSLENVDLSDDIIDQIQEKGNEVFDDIWSKQLAVRLVFQIRG